MNGSALDSIVAGPPPKKGGKKPPMAGMPHKKAAPAPAAAPDEAAEHLADMGRGGDTEIAHVTPGEIVLPPIDQMPPEFVAVVEKALGDMGYTLAERTVAAEGAGPENPQTGAEEFYGGGDPDDSADTGGAPGGVGAADGSPAGDGGGVMGGADVGGGVAGQGGFGGPGGYGRGDPDDTAHAGGRPGGGTPSSDVGVGGGFSSMAGFDRALDRAVRSFTKVDLLEGLEEYAKDFNQQARDEGISVVDGRGNDGTGPGASGAFGGGDAGNDAGGSFEPSIAPDSETNTPVDQGNTQQAPAGSSTARQVLDSPAVRDALAGMRSGGALDTFLATPNINRRTGTQMFAPGMDWRDPATGVTYNFNTAAERDEWRTNSEAGRRAEEGSAPAGQTVDQFKQERGTAWNNPGGGGYNLAREQGQNDPTSDPRNPQPFATAADDPAPAPTQTGVSANAIEAFSSLTPSRGVRFGTSRNRPNVNPVTQTQMFATRDNFDAAAYLADNPDVAEAGYTPETAFDHYEAFGRKEGRTGNAAEKGARAEGFDGVFGERGEGITGPRYTDWKAGRANEAGFIDPNTGGYRADLTSSRDDPNLGPSMTALAERAQGRQRGYGGDYGDGGYQRYMAAYFDDDGDGATPMVGHNLSNIDRSGGDASRIRNVVRSAGWTGPWGDSGNSAMEWVGRSLSDLGYTRSGDPEQDALRVDRAPQFDPSSYVPTWMRGAGRPGARGIDLKGAADFGSDMMGGGDAFQAREPFGRNPAGTVGTRTPNQTSPQQPIRTPTSAWGGAPGVARRIEDERPNGRTYGPAFTG